MLFLRFPMQGLHVFLKLLTVAKISEYPYRNYNLANLTSHKKQSTKFNLLYSIM